MNKLGKTALALVGVAAVAVVSSLLTIPVCGGGEHPDAAKEYESLKLRLWKRHEHDRDAYTDAKGGFVAKWTAEARKEYGGRY